METFQQKLYLEWEKRRAKNPRYSLRSFARVLNLSPGALSSYLSGKRKLTPKAANKIMSQLSLNLDEKNAWQSLMPAKSRAGQTYHELTADQHRIVSEWYHYAILSLVKVKDFEPNSAWISKRLGISQSQAEQATERLFRLGFLKKKGAKWIRVVPNLTTKNDQPNELLRYAHMKNLEMASDAIQTQSVEDREFQAMTLAFDSSKKELSKKLIREFLKDFSEKMESQNYDQVSKICIQFFNLTKEGNKK
jgi:transcriptional regulator with XRE-family HTH domain